MQFSVLENGTGFLLLGILSQNVFNTPDNTWKSLQKLTCNPDIAVLKGDKDSSVVIIPRTSYNEKLQEMINDGITDGKYRRTSDNTTQDLQSFQSFLYRNFKNCKNENFDYDNVRPTSNKPAVLFATAKTHKFAEFKDITTENLKLRPIISTCGTYYYQSAKSLAKYLAPLAENEYTIKDTLESPDRLQDRTLDEDEVLVSYDVSSLFTEVLEEKRNFNITTSSETHRFKLGIGSQKKSKRRFPKLVTRCGLLTKLLMNLLVQLRIKTPFSRPSGSTTANPSHLKFRTASAMKMRQRS